MAASGLISSRIVDRGAPLAQAPYGFVRGVAFALLFESGIGLCGWVSFLLINRMWRPLMTMAEGLLAAAFGVTF